MSGNIATRSTGGAVAALQGLKSGLANVAKSIVVPGGDPFLRLVQGAWVYGADDLEVEEGALCAVNPLSLRHGWVAWTDYPAEMKKKNEIAGEVMVPMSAPLPAFTSLPDVSSFTGARWVQQLSLTIVITNGEDAGTQVDYKTNSVGGLRAVRELVEDIMQHLEADSDHPVPVIELGVDSYKHKTYGKTFTPVFAIKKWIALDDDSLPADDAGSDEEATQAGEPASAQANEPRGRRRPESDARDAVDVATSFANEVNEEAAADDAPAEATTTLRRRRR